MTTKKEVQRLLKKGLTGKEAARLILLDSWEVDNGREGFLSEGDIAAIRKGLASDADIREYNKWVELYSLMDYTMIDAQSAFLRAMLGIAEMEPKLLAFYVGEMLELAKHTLPRVVTQKQYEDIKTGQRERYLDSSLSIWEAMEWTRERHLELSPETLQEWKEANWAWENNEDGYGDECGSLFWWLLIHKPEEGGPLLDMLIQPIQAGSIRPVTLTKKQQEEIEAAREAQREAYDTFSFPEALSSWEDLRYEFVRKRKATKAGIERLVAKLEALRDGRLSLEEGERLLDSHYITGREWYEAGHAGWREFVDEFKIGWDDETAGLGGFAILQEEGWGGVKHLDERGYYDQEYHDKALQSVALLTHYMEAWSQVGQTAGRVETDREGWRVEAKGQRIRGHFPTLVWSGLSGFEIYLRNEYLRIKAHIKVFLAMYSVTEAAAAAAGIPFTERLDGWRRELEGKVDHFNYLLKLANVTGRNPYHKGRPEIKLPLLDISRLRPDKEELEYLRERMALALGPKWFKDETLRLMEEAMAVTDEDLAELEAEQELRGQYRDEFYKSLRSEDEEPEDELEEEAHG